MHYTFPGGYEFLMQNCMSFIYDEEARKLIPSDFLRYRGGQDMHLRIFSRRLHGSRFGRHGSEGRASACVQYSANPVRLGHVYPRGHRRAPKLRRI